MNIPLTIALIDVLLVFGLGCLIATAVTAPDRRRYRKACEAAAARRALRVHIVRPGLINELRSKA